MNAPTTVLELRPTGPPAASDAASAPSPPGYLDGWAWERRGRSTALVIDNPAALESLTRPYLSPSSANSVSDGCIARGFAEKLLRGTPSPFEATEIGTAWHSVMERLYALPPEQRTQAIATDLLVATTSQSFDPARELPQWGLLFSEVRQAGWGVFDKENPTDIDIIGLERRVEDVEISGVPFKGFIDVIRSNDKGEWIIRDWKTSNKLPDTKRFGDHHGDQLRLYVLAMRELGHPVKAAELFYTRRGIARIKPVAVAKDRLRATTRTFTAAWDTYRRCTETGEFPTEAGPLCGWCPLVASCPVARRKEFVDRSGKTAAGLSIEDRTVVDEPARRTPSRQHDTTTESTTQMDPKDIPYLDEGKSWDETINGQLNPNSHAASAVWSLTTQAARALHEAGAPMKRASLVALTNLFADVCAQVVAEITGDEETSFQSGAHSRARNALFATLETTPLPWGADADEWAAWTTRAVSRCNAMCETAILLHANGPESPDFETLSAIPGTPAALRTLRAVA